MFNTELSKAFTYDPTILREHLVRLHELISKKQTGNPDQLASKFNCHRSTVLNWIKELRSVNLPVAYCKSMCTYYYTHTVVVKVIITIGAEEQEQIIGGIDNNNSITNLCLESNFFTTVPYQLRI